MDVGIYLERGAHWQCGGIATYVRELAGAVSTDHTVYLYSGQGEPTARLSESAVNVVQIPPLPGENLLDRGLAVTTPLRDQLRGQLLTFGAGLRTNLGRHVDVHVDVLITHQWLDDLLVSNVVDVPVVYVLHGARSVGIGARARTSLSKSRYSLANSDSTARGIRRQTGREVDGILPPGVDTDLFTPEATPAFETDGFTVLFVGWVDPNKGLFDLVESVADSPGVNLQVVGAGELERARERARMYGVDSRVSFAGEVAHERLPGFYAAADAVCIPSYAESYGMANLEAMASGTPLIASDVGGVPEYATHRENSLLVEPGDTETIARYIRELASSPDLRSKLAANARETAQANTWSHRADRLESHLEDFLAPVVAR